MNEILRPQMTLGKILQDRALLNEQQLEEAMLLQESIGKRLGQIIIDKGWVTEQDVLGALAVQFGLPFVSLRPGLYDPAVGTLINRETAQRLEMLPLFELRGVLSVATSDPQAIPHLDEIKIRTGYKVRPVLARRGEILKAIEETYYGVALTDEYIEDVGSDFTLEEHQVIKDFSTIDELAEGSPVINLANAIIQRAVREGASDIHIEPSRKKCRVRFRIDGTLYEVMTPLISMHAALVSRLKVIANLDIAERRLPQDGRIQVSTQGRTVDLRFSSLPGIFGEKVVLRVLDKNRSILDINRLGMTAENVEKFKTLLARNNGLILVTGPTGSGKTTSLYAAINHLNSREKNIVTIEDPVEYQIDIVNQNQIKESIGLSFPLMLKHILRQDPDIIMVGEIRDHQTAEIAVQAALTGHLVLSTLHTNDSVGAITRLLDMGIEPYLLSSALIGVIGQRLVRNVCPDCSTFFLPSVELAGQLGLQESTTTRLAKGKGCTACYDSGYRGRLGIHEILISDSGLQGLMTRSPSREEIENYITGTEMKTLHDDGLDRVRKGRTTIEEINRAVNSW